MDVDGSFSSCSSAVQEEALFWNACCGSYWSWEEDKAFENALAVYQKDADPWGKFAAAIPGKTIEDVKLHYKALNDVVVMESGKVPLPHYPSNNRVCKKKEKPLRFGAKHEKDEEHSGSYWTKEEDKAFGNALVLYHGNPNLWNKIALAVPGKSIEELKLHYEALRDGAEEVDFGKVPLLHYSNKDRAHEKKGTSLRIGGKPASRWTDAEHGSFLLGLEKFGRGEWKSISEYYVLTKSNTQVASHAQKYFRALYSGMKNRKRSSVNYKCSAGMSSSKKPIGTTMPGYPPTQASTSAEAGIPAHSIFAPDLINHPMERGDSAVMPTYVPPGSSDVPAISDAMDMDIFNLPKLVDID